MFVISLLCHSIHVTHCLNGKGETISFLRHFPVVQSPFILAALFSLSTSGTDCGTKETVAADAVRTRGRRVPAFAVWSTGLCCGATHGAAVSPTAKHFSNIKNMQRERPLLERTMTKKKKRLIAFGIFEWK